MLQWYDWVLLATSVIIIVLCLLQGGKSEGASGAITGGGLNVFVKTKERGAEKVVSILTLVMAGIFFIIAVMINVMAQSKTLKTIKKTSTSMLDFFMFFDMYLNSFSWL